jgi:hypothetical protein
MKIRAEFEDLTWMTDSEASAYFRPTALCCIPEDETLYKLFSHGEDITSKLQRPTR